MFKTTSKKITALIAAILMVMTLVITAIAAPVHTHDGILPFALGNCCSNPCIENYLLDHVKTSTTHCVAYLRQYCWNCGAMEDFEGTSANGCTWWCTLTEWKYRKDPRI